MDITTLTEQPYTASKLPGISTKTFCLHLLSEDNEHEAQFTLTPKEESTLYSNLIRIMELLNKKRK